MNKAKAMVVALGNPLMGDDGFGARVMERIRGYPDLQDVDLLDAHTDLLTEIDAFTDYSLVILLDAILGQESILQPAERVVVIEEPRLLSFPDDASSIHQISPVTALKLFRQLHPESTTRFVLVACTARELAFSNTVGEDVIECAANRTFEILSSYSQ